MKLSQQIIPERRKLVPRFVLDEVAIYCCLPARRDSAGWDSSRIEQSSQLPNSQSAVQAPADGAALNAVKDFDSGRENQTT